MEENRREDLWIAIKRRRQNELGGLLVPELKTLCSLMSLPKSGTKAALITRLVTSLETSFRVSMDRFESQETRRKALDELKSWFRAIDEAHEAKKASRTSRGRPPSTISSSSTAAAAAASNTSSSSSASRTTCGVSQPIPLGRSSSSSSMASLPNPLSSYNAFGPGHGIVGVSSSSSTPYSYNPYSQGQAPQVPLPPASLKSHTPTSSLLSNFSYRTSTYTARCTLLIPQTPASTVSTHPLINGSSTEYGDTGVLDDLVTRIKDWDPFLHPLIPLSKPFRTYRVKSSTLKVGKADSRPRLEPKSVGKPGEGNTDNHVWGKGTDVFVDGEFKGVRQRKQQSHDKSKWLGMCHAMRCKGRKGRVEVVVTQEDEEGYVGIVFAGMRRGEEEVIEDILKSGIENRSVKRGVEDAVGWARGKAVCLDGEGEEDMKGLKVRLSLNDVNSMQVIGTPVVGRNCQHSQAFDLGYFVKMNGFPSARRWACPVCGKRIKVSELLKSGLFAEALGKGDQGKVLTVDCDSGTWEVGEDDVGANRRKRKAEGGGREEEGLEKKLKSTMAQSPNLDKGGRKEVVTPAPRAEIEVIEIDSD